MIVAVTGPNAAGKGAVAEHLIGKGFRYFSLSDVVRQELEQQGLSTNRTRMTEAGAHLRRTFGAGVLATRIQPQLVDRSVVDSIRHPEEVAVLRRAGDLLLIGITAPSSIRLERTRRRGRPGDTKEQEAFLAEEAAQNSTDPEGQRIADCLALADATIINTGTVDHLHREVDRLLKERFGIA